MNGKKTVSFEVSIAMRQSTSGATVSRFAVIIWTTPFAVPHWPLQRALKGSRTSSIPAITGSLRGRVALQELP